MSIKQMRKQMFKICVVGCGGMSTSGHGPSFSKYKREYLNVSLAGCCDLIEEKAITYKNKFGFEKHYIDYKKMIEEIKPDVVCLITPVYLTSQLAIDIMKLGCNVILEKPPGVCREEIENMVYQAKQSNVSVRTAFNRRYTPLILKLKEFLREQQDRIFNVTYQMYRCGRTDKDFSTTAIHAIDVVKNIVNSNYKSVYFTYQELPEHGENVANIYLDCIFDSGAIAQVSLIPMGGVVSEHISVNTLNNTYFVELPFWKNLDSPGRLRHVKENSIVKDISGNELIDSCEMYEESGFYEENRSFFEDIRSKKGVICDLESAIQPVEIASYIRMRMQKYENR